MPVIGLERGDGQALVDGFLENYIPYGVEFTVGETEENLINFKPLREKGIRVWVNSLWRHYNAGHHDDVALENPNVYEWYIEKGVNMIQTDRIKELVEFLRKRGLKN
jgi:glycerophosphoryl diester phosphodiesterase